MKEDQHTEFKENFKDDYLKVIAAFANSDGGKLIIGVTDKGKTIGVDNTKKLLEDIPNKIKNYLQITPTVSVEKRDNKEIITINVSPSSFPIFYHSKLYIRSGSTTQELTGLELASFLLQKSGKTWDSLPSEGTMEDFDNETIETFITLAKNRLPLVTSIRSTQELLEKLKLITEKEKLTRAAVLLFSKDPQKYFPTAYVKVGRFRTPSTILDTVIVQGNLFQQLNKTMEAIKKHLSVRFDTTVDNVSLEGLSRKDIWEYPLEALREAIINSIIHRDYLGTSPIQIKIFDDSISIWNPGKLIPPLTIELLKKPHSGYQRNPMLALVFYYAGLIEAWGSGIDKIISLCKSQNIPEPNFEERKEGLGEFTVYFYKDVFNEENLQKLGLNERQIKAVEFTKKHKYITISLYAQIINDISEKTLYRDLQDLVKKGLFKEFGEKKGRKYVIGHFSDITDI